MELSSQMKKYRTQAGLSQDALAEKIFVSRQTISNWETGKNYPDINSLLRMSEVFGVSVDVLLKGDVEEIREMIQKEDQKEFEKWSAIYNVTSILMMTTPVALVMLLKLWGVVIWGCLAAVSIGVACVVEKKKKEFNVQTYREILAFMEGKRLDEIESVKEEAKRPYQKTILAIAYGMITLVINVLLWLILRNVLK